MHSRMVRTAAESFFSRSARSSGVAFRRRWVDFAWDAVRDEPQTLSGANSDIGD